MFAEERSFDPLLADNWYNTPADSVVSAKVCKKMQERDEGEGRDGGGKGEMLTPYQAGQTVLSYYGGSYVKAVVQIYPDVNLQETKFMNLPSKY